MNIILTVLMTLCLSLASIFLFAFQTSAATGEEKTIILPPPDTQNGMPLMRALAERKSTRAFKKEPLALQDISNLFWAVFGVNRPDGRRTAPTARNTQAVAVYAAMENGVWRYDGIKHELVKELDRDARSVFGGAPLTLVYAADKGSYGAMHIGSLYQNAGLYCASAGLGNVVKATGIDALQKELRLPEGYAVLIIQSVGIPE